ncbi:cell division FtsA domain-containing protein [Athalassotoga saccharophila]|uniref:cell division FtsA domain-containing protein n=1 Tax=Athalassotoga saccharophila TaxID=1441386 RepID=UPI0013793B79|nr:cell division FtsA domain-containing protein [Athalassotoga saccharophila]BBJ28099.1 cell division protein FtsA [Athalassotoga saccharophila]
MAKVGGITVVDIGSYNIKSAFAERVADGFKILSYTSVKSNGMYGGQIVDALSLRASVGEALGELQTQLMKKALGGHLVVTASENFFSLELAKISKEFSKIETISPVHIQEIRKEAVKSSDIIDVIPVRYTLDDGRKVINPLSMATSKIHADIVKVKMDPLPKNELMNLFQGYVFDSVSVLHPGLVAGEGVLTENEKNRGIICLDFGYSTFKMIAYMDGMPIGYKFIPFGIEKMIKDIATVFKVSYPEAERVLFYHSNLDYEKLNENDMVEVVDFSKTKKSVKKRSISMTAYARAKEMLSLSRRSLNEILNANPSFNPIGIVITGGGASIPGISSVAGTIFNISARNGNYISSNNVIVTGAEDVMGVPAYGPLFGSYIYAYKYGRLETKPVQQTSAPAVNVQNPQQTTEEKVGESVQNGTFKKLWDFLKKLV